MLQILKKNILYFFLPIKKKGEYKFIDRNDCHILILKLAFIYFF